MIGTLSLTNCTKDETDNGFGSVDATENLITRTVTVSDEAWDEVRSSYEPGVGIHLDGTEHMSVYYSVSGTTAQALGYKLLDVADGAPDGNGSYTFSHPEVTGAETYDYYFMMPYLVTSKLNNAGSASYHRIGPVQMPKADTFDPSFDYIVGKPALNVAAADQNAVVTRFKRLMAPLRLKFTDNAGILAGQKIRQVTIGFDVPADKASDKCMSGLFYFQYSEQADECHISGWQDGSFSNTATADYPTGLEQEGSWETWLMVNPVELEACNMTIDVVSDKMRITRTVPTGKVFNLTKEAINTLSFDISGDGYATENAYTVDFTQSTKVPTAIEASDGHSYEWTFANCSITTQANLGNALRLKNTTNNGSITLPALPEGTTYKAIYLTENTNNSSKAANIVCKQDDQEAATGTFYYYGEVSQQGGVLKLEIPAEYAQGPLTIEHDCADAVWINRMTVTYEGDLHMVDENDYYSLYLNGEDIQIGNITINKESHPDAKIVYMDSGSSEDNIRTSILQKGGVIFLDTYHNANMSEAKDQVLTLTGNLQPIANTIIIGRYKNKQSKLECTEYTDSSNKLAGTYVQVDRASGGMFAIKNLDIKGHTLTGHLFAKGSNHTQDITDFIVEDCTVSAYQNVFSFSNTTKEYVVQNVYFNNSIFNLLGVNGNYSVIRLAQLYDANGNKTSNLAFDRIKSVTMNNCVIYCSDAAFTSGRRTAIEYGYGASNTDRWANPTTNLEITFTNNTLYNAYGSGACVIRAYQAKKATVTNNAYYLDVTKPAVTSNPYMLGIYADLEGNEGYALIDNTAYTYGEKTGNNITGLTWRYGTAVTYTQQGLKTLFNQSQQNGMFQSTMDIQTGYFPIDKSVVTNGAGASYETKLWNKWE